MIKMTASKWLIFLLILLVPSIVLASAAEWRMIPEESSITFTGIQNGAPASGSFKKFSSVINLDPAQLNDSKVRIVIDMNSVSTSFSDFAATLITADWFNTKLFPQAIFESKQFVKIGDNKYQGNGTLTIRGKTEPVSITFVTEALSKNKGRVKGSVTLKRTTFGIGQGEWADTDAVKDEVQVDFVITADKNASG